MATAQIDPSSLSQSSPIQLIVSNHDNKYFGDQQNRSQSVQNPAKAQDRNDRDGDKATARNFTL